MSEIMSSRRALVTGGSGELGGAICHALAAAGWQVIVHGHQSLDRAEETAAAIRAAGGSAQAIAFDVTDAEVTRAALEVLLSEGAIHALVNNAGVHDDAPMAGMSDEQWHRVIDVSLHGFFHVTQPLLLPMARARFGRIVVGQFGGGAAGQSRPDQLRGGEGGAARRAASRWRARWPRAASPSTWWRPA